MTSLSSSNSWTPQNFSPISSELLGLDLPVQTRFYQQMFLIRVVEERLLELFSQGQIFGTTHTSIGQEANAVGVLNALDREKDIVWSNHRCHGHFLASANSATFLVMIDGFVAIVLFIVYRLPQLWQCLIFLCLGRLCIQPLISQFFHFLLC